MPASPQRGGCCTATNRIDDAGVDRRLRAHIAPNELPTPRTTLRSGYVRVLVWCMACRHRRNADLQGLVDAGRGDVPLVHLRFRCANCGRRLTDFVVTATEETGQPR